MAESTVIIDQVVKHYGRHEALKGVSFRLEPGESIALVGHNGAGKTTLLKLMLGLTRPTSGTVRVLGEDPAASPAIRARHGIGFLPETVAFNPAMTGAEVITFFARLKREGRAEARRLLEQVGLATAARRRVGGYSKGMRQRLGLAQALLGAPRVLLLDEPTTGLDPELRLAFYDIVEAARDAGTTVLLSSHILTEIEERADRVIIMHQGRLVAIGTIGELRRLSHLPVRVRLELAEGAGEIAQALDGLVLGKPHVNGHAVELACAPEHKIEVMRRATALGPRLRELELQQPSLDDLYAHFLREQRAA
jgi:Cu-processing system ATP-binding protein